ncbi:MAG TPA: hypothetical protein PLA27_05680 [Anaerolineales bacterium]|jgi:hypothetical protein|nr:hypothetical protein [Anaerolineales bacterium]HQX15893.1 hypothetical protein [Anaerolineales bacterium]
MTPEEFFPFFAAYAICASGVIFFSLFAVTVFLGLTILDIWNSIKYPRPMRIFLCVCAALYPEIGVMSWAIFFGRPRKLIFRLIAFGTSGVYLLLQIGWFYLSMHDKGFGAGLISGFMAHIIWYPFVLVGGAISFFVLRAILNKNNVSTTTPEVQSKTS